jgi:hypothetical protein
MDSPAKGIPLSPPRLQLEPDLGRGFLLFEFQNQGFAFSTKTRFSWRLEIHIAFCFNELIFRDCGHELRLETAKIALFCAASDKFLRE